MRWQRLFDDLRAQFEAEEAAAERGERASRARAEMGAVRLADRLAGSLGTGVGLGLRGGIPVTGVLADLGPDWALLVDEAQSREQLVALAAVRTVVGLSRRTAVPEGGAVRAQLDLRRALRGLTRDRAPVQLVLDDGGTLTGTLDRVGADYVELATHPLDEPRRAEAVRGVQAVVIGAIAVVRAVSPGFG